MKKLYHANTNTNEKKVGVAIVISGKVDSREEYITRDKDCHFTMVRHQLIKMT